MSFKFVKTCPVCNEIVFEAEYDSQYELDRHNKLMSYASFCKKHEGLKDSYWYTLNVKYPIAYIRNDLSIIRIIKKELEENV